MGYAILDQRGGDSLTATTLDGYSLLADTTVSSATTTVNFTGLNIGWGDELLLVADIINAGSGCDYYLYANGNTTKTNYYCEALFVNSTSVSAGSGNRPTLSYLDASTKCNSIVKIKITNNGFIVHQSNVNRNYGGSSVSQDKFYSTSMFTISSISSLTITADVSNQINTNSRFQLYKSGGGASRTWAIT